MDARVGINVVSAISFLVCIDASIFINMSVQTELIIAGSVAFMLWVGLNLLRFRIEARQVQKERDLKLVQDILDL